MLFYVKDFIRCKLGSALKDMKQNMDMAKHNIQRQRPAVYHVIKFLSVDFVLDNNVV